MKTIIEYIQKKQITETNYVDLGLPSGTKWAKYNISVDPTKLTKPEDWYGLYFAWGETKGYKVSDKHDFSWYNYQFGRKDYLIKYNKDDNLIQLEKEDDAAYKATNGEFRMPTDKELEELYQKTNNIWVNDYNGIKGLNGRLFVSKKDETKSIFIPASGDREGYNIYSGNSFDIWSSNYNNTDPNIARTLYNNKDYICVYSDIRCNGFTIRGVLNK